MKALRICARWYLQVQPSLAFTLLCWFQAQRPGGVFSSPAALASCVHVYSVLHERVRLRMLTLVLVVFGTQEGRKCRPLFSSLISRTSKHRQVVEECSISLSGWFATNGDTLARASSRSRLMIPTSWHAPCLSLLGLSSVSSHLIIHTNTIITPNRDTPAVLPLLLRLWSKPTVTVSMRWSGK